MYFKIKSEAQEALKKAVDQFDCDFDDEIKGYKSKRTTMVYQSDNDYYGGLDNN
jgi:hypothetical protein